MNVKMTLVIGGVGVNGCECQGETELAPDPLT